MGGSREEEAARGESRRSAFLRLAKDVERLRQRAQTAKSLKDEEEEEENEQLIGDKFDNAMGPPPPPFLLALLQEAEKKHGAREERLQKQLADLRLQNLKLRAQLRRSERQRDEVERLLSLALTPEPETGREASRRATKEHVECVLCLADAEESPLQRVVFLPCGHLCCCLSCGEPLRRCPLCRATIEQQVLVFLP